MFRVIFRPGSFTEEALREMTGLWDMGLSGVKACMILQGIMCLVLFLTPLVAVGKAALADEDDGILPWLSGLYAPITWLISDFLLMGCFNLTDDIFETFQAIGLGGVALVIGVILGLMTTSAPVLILFIGSDGN